MNPLRLFALLALLSMARSADAQQRVFNWVAGEQEQVRLQPGMYYAVGPFAFKPDFLQKGMVKLAMQAAKPVFIGVVPQSAWNYVVQNPQTVTQLQYFCLKENVLQLDYSCGNLNTFNSPFVVVIHDLTDPNAQLGRAILLGGLGLYAHSKKLLEQAAAEGVKPTGNDVSITHYSWLCVQNCDIPRFVWGEVIKEKFPILRVVKSYGPFTSQRSGNQMRIHLDSPVPMAFGLVSSEEAANVRTNPDNFYSVIAKSSCQQRAAQKINMTCPTTGNPQEIVLLPENGVVQIPNNKKASFNVALPECIENCN